MRNLEHPTKFLKLVNLLDLENEDLTLYTSTMVKKHF